MSDGKKVKAWLVQGLSHRQIAKRLGITEAELQDTYAHELQVARAEARAVVGGQLFKSAMAGKLAAIAFFLKTRAGWSETRHLEDNQPIQDEPDPDAPPKIVDMGFHLGCNARDGCWKSGPKERLAAFKEIHKELLARATSTNMSLDFVRPTDLKLVHMWRIYKWQHGDRAERDS